MERPKCGSSKDLLTIQNIQAHLRTVARVGSWFRLHVFILEQVLHSLYFISGKKGLRLAKSITILTQLNMLERELNGGNGNIQYVQETFVS